MTTTVKDELFTLDLGMIITDSVDRTGRSRRLSRKQAVIMSAVNEQGAITLDVATVLVGRDVYYNQKKHTGALLSNMVKRGLLTRQSPGVFKSV